MTGSSQGSDTSQPFCVEVRTRYVFTVVVLVTAGLPALVAHSSGAALRLA
jgi:hypothetical protein